MDDLKDVLLKINTDLSKEYKKWAKFGEIEILIKNRQSCLRTSDPEIEIMHAKEVLDVFLAENIIHEYLNHLRHNFEKIIQKYQNHLRHDVGYYQKIEQIK